ncbi:hypothetical protein [Homoserinibacter sp. GY 40078]|uniref:hypothetical protein n=1 Tax=Homoserinibacter sp. GY 40078 TaxID=2603275 RepID=UPI0011C9F146|nr:hypothetical protein [Homoserinibacter sp. GY 40078]TXK17750.1 hypothetical protein FVQ89_13210 [Homoserinibacter sp. GY 40078]
MTPDGTRRGPRIELWWIPVGAGGHVVVHTSRWWELWRAHQERRAPRPLFHAALIVHDGEREHDIEMAPAWGRGSRSPGVVATGPVGMRLLGASRFFRYEIRCGRGTRIPDLAFAVDSPQVFPVTPAAARELLDRPAHAPLLVWGREAYGSGDMWNSNSLVAWLLTAAGIDAENLAPPHDGSAPGWIAGLAASRAASR